MREFKASERQKEALRQTPAAKRRLALQSEVLVIMLLHSLTGKSSSGSQHCF